MNLLFWIVTLLIAFLAGKAVSKIKLPAILGWLIAGMLLGPNALALLPQEVLDASWYKTVIMWMQCAFGLMLGTELVWRKIKNYGKALMVTTLTQSLGTFAFVTLVFGIVFGCMGIPVYLAFAFGGIALATAPAPALSIVSEFHTKGPVTDTLLPMAVLDDIVGIAVFFTVNAFVARRVSGGRSITSDDSGHDFSADYSRSGDRDYRRHGIEESKWEGNYTCDSYCRNHDHGHNRILVKYKSIHQHYA